MKNSTTASTISKQDYETPQSLVDLIAKRFGVNFVLDLAATSENKKAPACLKIKSNSLKQDWKINFSVEAAHYKKDACWLNPPYQNVSPWMEKCKLESENGLKIVSLTLASIGSAWYRDHVEGSAMSFILRDRVVFVGEKDPFPKDLMVSLWGFGMSGLGFWSWKK